jgi:hypothetical protein
MSTPSDTMRRELRWLRTYTIVTTALLAVVSLAAFRRAEQRTHFTELDVERLNVRTPDGRLAVVIATPERFPGNVMRGRERRDSPRGGGLVFYDSQGNEAGGLVFDSRLRVVGRDTIVEAGHQLSLDRYESDQVAALKYSEDSAGWSAGLQVSHFPRHTVAEWMDGRDAIDQLPPARRDSALRALRRRFIREGKWEVPRVFVGERGRTAMLEMRDTHGRERVRLVVDSADVARLEFLDDSGRVVHRLPNAAPAAGQRPNGF